MMPSPPQCPSLILPPQTLFPSKHHITPPTLPIPLLAYTSVQDFHPSLFISRSIGVEIYDFAVVEADSEAFFDEHVAFFFFCEAGFAALAAFARGFFLREGTAVVD
jgi:hypothetical protein